MPDPEEATDSEAFVSNVPLTDVFGSHPKTEILAALLAEAPDPTTHFTINEVKRISGVETETVEEHIDDLISYEIVIETDDLADEETNTYKLNEESPVVSDIRQLYTDLFEAIPESDTNG